MAKNERETRVARALTPLTAAGEIFLFIKRREKRNIDSGPRPSPVCVLPLSRIVNAITCTLYSGLRKL